MNRLSAKIQVSELTGIDTRVAVEREFLPWLRRIVPDSEGGDVRELLI
jgi:hypothetical protein